MSSLWAKKRERMMRDTLLEKKQIRFILPPFCCHQWQEAESSSNVCSLPGMMLVFGEDACIRGEQGSLGIDGGREVSKMSFPLFIVTMEVLLGCSSCHFFLNNTALKRRNVIGAIEDKNINYSDARHDWGRMAIGKSMELMENILLSLVNICFCVHNVDMLLSDDGKTTE